MVDFNNEVTVGLPAWNILKVLVLQRRDDFINALEAYNRALKQGIAARDYEVAARLNSLFQELRPHIRASVKPEDFAIIEAKATNPGGQKDIMDAWNYLNEWLYNKELTKWDGKKQYDRTRTERENKETGLG